MPNGREDAAPTFDASGPSRSLKREWMPPVVVANSGRVGEALVVVEATSPQKQVEPSPPPRGRIAATTAAPSRTIAIDAPSSHRQPSRETPSWYEDDVSVPSTTAAQQGPAAAAVDSQSSVPHEERLIATPQRSTAGTTTWVGASASRHLAVQPTPSRRAVHTSDDDLATEGPAKPLLKSWSTQLPDTAIPYVDIDEVETRRERRRRHPDAPLLNTRARFMRDLGLTEADTVDPESGKSFLTLDDARRAYYGHPEDAAWVAFFSSVGRPMEDYVWLKTQVFVDDETATAVHPHLLQDTGAAATAAASTLRHVDDDSNGQGSISVGGRAVTASYASHLVAAWSVLTPNMQRDKTARDAMIETFRQSQSAAKRAASPTSPSPLRQCEERSGGLKTLDATEHGVVALFQQHEEEDQQPQPQWLVDMRTASQQRQQLQEQEAEAAAIAATTATPQLSGTTATAPAAVVGMAVESPIGSVRRHAGGDRPDAVHSSSGRLQSGHGTLLDDGIVQPPHSSSVSLPITDRYRTATTPLVATMPSIRSGREYRNQMRRTFMDRKEKGIASAPPNPLSPRKPVEALIGPAAHAILYGSNE